ncbi:MAG: DUF1700 domain-containing protein, partial [Clostridiales bacterium]|nr:DUF1700 domain-containing protein [Clostridiales bacterium]
LNELSSYLKSGNIEDIDEILAEYDEHFMRKMADGYTEEEIAAKLGKPKEIAAQFKPVGIKADQRKGGKIVIGTGLVFADIFVVSFFIVLYAWAIVLGAAALGSAVCGLSLFIRPLLPAGIIFLPPMPYIGGVILGVTLLAFGVLLAVVTVYSWTLTNQLGKAYRRWHKNMMSDGKFPPLAKHPMVKDVTRRKLRTVTLIALIALGVSFIIGYIVMAASAGALGFWHAWKWFA